jgi:hypothetical protein
MNGVGLMFLVIVVAAFIKLIWRYSELEHKMEVLENTFGHDVINDVFSGKLTGQRSLMKQEVTLGIVLFHLKKNAVIVWRLSQFYVFLRFFKIKDKNISL